MPSPVLFFSYLERSVTEARCENDTMLFAAGRHASCSDLAGLYSRYIEAGLTRCLTVCVSLCRINLKQFCMGRCLFFL